MTARRREWVLWSAGKATSAPPPVEEVRFGIDGFSVLHEGRLAFHVEWAKVVGIAAFKRDLFTVNEICLGFRYAGSWEYPFVSERALGFAELQEAVYQRFAGCDRQWYEKVVLPPFETCWTQVWGDAPEPISCPQCGYNLCGLESRRCPECGHTIPPDACPSCLGRGEFKYYGLVWPACAIAVLGTILFIVLSAVSGGRLKFVGASLLIGGVTTLLVNLIAGRTTCSRCKGTGRRAGDRNAK